MKLISTFSIVIVLMFGLETKAQTPSATVAPAVTAPAIESSPTPTKKASKARAKATKVRAKAVATPPLVVEPMPSPTVAPSTPTSNDSLEERYEKAREAVKRGEEGVVVGDGASDGAKAPEEKKTTGEKVGDVFEGAGNQIKKTFGNSRERRADSKVVALLNYSFFDLVIPSKIGLTAGYVESANTTWELEYLRASLSVPFLVDDIGKMTDQRTSLIRRSFIGKNSFNFSYGVTYFDFGVRVGNEILQRIDPSYPGGMDLITIQGFGLNVGFGNRWTIQKNITIGVDWLSLSQPLILTGKKSGILNYINNANDRDNVGDAINIVSYFPRFAAIKAQVGIMF